MPAPNPRPTAPLEPDRTDAARARRRTALLQVLTAALSRAVTLDEVARTTVETVMRSTGAVQGGVWSLEPDADAAVLVYGSGYPPETLRRFERIPLAGPLNPLIDALAAREPVFLSSRRALRSRYPAADASVGEYTTRDFAITCIPLEAEGRIVGAVSWSFPASRRFPEADRTFLVIQARHAAQALARARLFDAERAARERAEAAERRSAFLSEASAILGGSLEYEETLRSVARLAVPQIADWCSVELAETFVPGREALAVAHVDPRKVEMAREWRQRYPPEPDAAYGVPQVIRTGRSELYAEIPEQMVVAGARDAEHLRVIRALGMTSAMIVPLRARERTFGAITFVSAESGRRYGRADLEMAEHLGRRAGLAVDNARLYADAQGAVRARDEVLAVVSHDLKNPLGAIMLSSSLLATGSSDPRARRYAETIRRSAERMNRLIRDLLDAASMDQGRLRVEPKPEPLEAVVDEVVALLMPLAGERRIGIRIEAAPIGAPVACDRERVAQVISNLVGNAVQHTAQGGEVVVRVGADAGEARVEVVDQGPGIAPEDLPRVFDRYWSRSRGGTGLGLAIAKGLVEAHGGRIWARSVVGAGSTFGFGLPLG